MSANETIEILRELAVAYEKLRGLDAKPVILSDEVSKLSVEELAHELVRAAHKLLGPNEKKE